MVKVYCLEPFDQVVEQHPSVDFDIYIDDIQMAAQGTEDQVAERLVSAAVDMRAAVQDEIKAALATHKAATVASTTRLAKRLRRALGQDGGAECESTPALGIDFCCGKLHRHKLMATRKKRLRAVAARRERIAILSKACHGKPKANAHKLVKAGVKPAALYGACVTGITDTQLVCLRRTSAAATAPRAQGRSLDIALQLAGLDPTADATAAPMVRWAQEVWAATSGYSTRHLDLRLLRDGWHGVLQDAPQQWRQVRGPIGAAVMSARRIGWDVSHPFEWVTDEGLLLMLAQESPALVAWHVEQSAQRLVERRVASSTGDMELQGRRANLGFTKRLLQSRAKNAMPLMDKGVLRTVQANGIWTRQRQYEAGYEPDPLCQMCDAQEHDTAHHRAWCCQWLQAVEAREKIASPQLIHEAQGQPDSVYFTRGIRAHPTDLRQVVDKQRVRFWRNGEEILDPTAWSMSGSIFYDGSCLRAREPALSTASFAIVEIDDDGVPTAVCEGTVRPELPQTSQAGEQSGRLAAVQLIGNASTLHGDCEAVVSGAQAPTHIAASHKKLYGGCRRAAIASGHNHLATDVKVKAHRSMDSALDEHDKWLIVGNAAADKHAVAAQGLHPQPGGDSVRQRIEQDQKLETVCRVIGATVGLWPATVRKERPEGKCEGGRRKKPIARPQQAHDWVARGNQYLCKACLKGAQSLKGVDLQATRECPGANCKLVAVMAHPNEHVLAATQDRHGQGVLLCVYCGSWASKCPRALARRCPGRQQASSAGQAVLRRVARGRHPMHGKGAIDCPLVAVQTEHQDAAAAIFDALLSRSSAQQTGRVSAPGVMVPSGSAPPTSAAMARIAASRERVLSRLRASSGTARRAL